MKSLLQRLASWVYLKCGGDPISLARRTLDSIDGIPDYTESLSQTDKIRFLADVANLLNNRSFMDTLRFLTQAQKDRIVREGTAQTFDFARGTLNGIGLVLDEINHAKTRLSQEKVETTFDQYQVL